MFGMQIIAISNNVIKKTSLETNFSGTAVLLMNSNSCNLNIILNFLLRFIRVSQTHMLQHAYQKHIVFSKWKNSLTFMQKIPLHVHAQTNARADLFTVGTFQSFTTQLYLIKFKLSALFFYIFEQYLCSAFFHSNSSVY